MTREEASEMIKNDMRLHHDDLSGKYRKALKLAISALEQPEIIRCKECKYNYGRTHCGEYNLDDIVCDYFDTDGLTVDDYCSYGERRTDKSNV